MYCLNCGKESSALICPDCRTEQTLGEIYHDICYFKEEDCLHPYVLKFAHSLQEPDVMRNYVPKVLGLFDDSVAEYYWCQYYKAVRDPRYENLAISYLNGHSLEEFKSQRILYGLIGYYLPDEFIKPGRWCKLIKDRDDLAFDLYATAADYYSRIGDYDIADQLINRAEKMIAPDDFYALWCKADSADKKIEKLRTDNTRRRKKPYWPVTEERRRALASFYDERGIEYPRITTKPAKVPESEFEGIRDVDTLSTNYCAFWCSEVFGVTAAKDICQIAAVRIRNGKIDTAFESLIRPWSSSKERAAKDAGVEVEEILSAEDVDQVLHHFYEFVGTDVLMATGALSGQAKLLARASRYAGMRSIPNEMFDLLDYAAEVDSKFDGKNNTREFLLSYFGMTEGKSAMEKAMKNIELYEALNRIDQ